VFRQRLQRRLLNAAAAEPTMVTRSTLSLVALALASTAHAQSCGRWEVVPTPNPPLADRVILNGVTAISPEDAWAVGEWSGYVDNTYQNFALAMHWDGESWSIIDTPQPAPCDECHYVALNAVDATGPNDVWAAGGQRIQAPDGFVGTHILVMHWDGSSWEVMDTPVPNGSSGDFIWDVQALAPDDVWFFGENRYDPDLLLQLAIALHWDGSSFEFIEVPIVNFKGGGFGNGNSLRAGSALAPDDIWAVGAAGDGDDISCDLSQIHHWDGHEWTHVPSQAPDGCFWHSLSAVHAVAENDVWAGGETFDGDYHSLSLHWNGQSWTEEPMPIAVSDFLSFAPDEVYAVGTGIARWQDGAWQVVEAFGEVVGPNLTSVDAAGPCAAWGAGRQLVGEEFSLRAFTARLVPGDACAPDLNGDGSLDLFDFLAFVNAFNAQEPVGDWDGDGEFSLFDFLAFVNAFNTGC
jgi:hypothetical protein